MEESYNYPKKKGHFGLYFHAAFKFNIFKNTNLIPAKQETNGNNELSINLRTSQELTEREKGELLHPPYIETSFAFSSTATMHDASEFFKSILFREYLPGGAHEHPSLDRRRPQSTFLVIEVEFRDIIELLSKSVGNRPGN